MLVTFTPLSFCCTIPANVSAQNKPLTDTALQISAERYARHRQMQASVRGREELGCATVCGASSKASIIIAAS